MKDSSQSKKGRGLMSSKSVEGMKQRSGRAFWVHRDTGNLAIVDLQFYFDDQNATATLPGNFFLHGSDDAEDPLCASCNPLMRYVEAVTLLLDGENMALSTSFATTGEIYGNLLNDTAAAETLF